MGASNRNLGSVAYAHCSKNRFLTVYRPFFTVFLATPTRDELDEFRARAVFRFVDTVKKR